MFRINGNLDLYISFFTSSQAAKYLHPGSRNSWRNWLVDRRARYQSMAKNVAVFYKIVSLTWKVTSSQSLQISTWAMLFLIKKKTLALQNHNQQFHCCSCCVAAQNTPIDNTMNYDVFLLSESVIISTCNQKRCRFSP